MTFVENLYEFWLLYRNCRYNEAEANNTEETFNVEESFNDANEWMLDGDFNPFSLSLSNEGKRDRETKLSEWLNGGMKREFIH